MNTRFYDTDLTDAAWACVGPVLPAARPVGRPRTTNLRAVLNAIFYLLRTGCQWRLLPREFPPCGTVYHYFRAWQNSGVWVHLHRVLYELRFRVNAVGETFEVGMSAFQLIDEVQQSFHAAAKAIQFPNH